MAEPAVQDPVDPRLVEVFRAVLQNPTLELRSSMRRADVAGWNSLAQVQLVLSVEKRFGIRFTTADIAKFSTVSQLAELIHQKLALGSASL